MHHAQHCVGLAHTLGHREVARLVRQRSKRLVLARLRQLLHGLRRVPGQHHLLDHLHQPRPRHHLRQRRCHARLLPARCDRRDLALRPAAARTARLLRLLPRGAQLGHERRHLLDPPWARRCELLIGEPHLLQLALRRSHHLLQLAPCWRLVERIAHALKHVKRHLLLPPLGHTCEHAPQPRILHLAHAARLGGLGRGSGRLVPAIGVSVLVILASVVTHVRVLQTARARRHLHVLAERRLLQRRKPSRRHHIRQRLQPGAREGLELFDRLDARRQHARDHVRLGQARRRKHPAQRTLLLAQRTLLRRPRLLLRRALGRRRGRGRLGPAHLAHRLGLGLAVLGTIVRWTVAVVLAPHAGVALQLRQREVMLGQARHLGAVTRRLLGLEAEHDEARHPLGPARLLHGLDPCPLARHVAHAVREHLGMKHHALDGVHVLPVNRRHVRHSFREFC
eukprot:scaffold48408_cov57-Phaeocystis_antarctica.AAC.1